MSGHNCNKRAFGSVAAAHAAVAGMGNSVRVYRCDECFKLHVTKERYGGTKRNGWV